MSLNFSIAELNWNFSCTFDENGLVQKCTSYLFGDYIKQILCTHDKISHFVSELNRVLLSDEEDFDDTEEEFISFFKFIFQNTPNNEHSLISSSLELDDTCELPTFILLMLKIRKELYNQRLTNLLLVDLLPGTGKSYSINKLIELLQNQKPIVITTPTYQTAKDFKIQSNGTANTLHSVFNINPENPQNFSYDLAPPWTKKMINSSNLFIFDECSMYGADLLWPILDELERQQKIIVLMGDVCQLPPVMQKRIDWFSLESENYNRIKSGAFWYVLHLLIFFFFLIY